MENINKIINEKINFLHQRSINLTNKDKYNLFDDFNIIYYNGVTIPRITLLNPLFIKSIIPPIINKDLRKCKELLNKDKQLEIIIPISENNDRKLESENEYIQKTNSNEINNNEENKISNNYNLLNKERINNVIKFFYNTNNVEKKNKEKKFTYNTHYSLTQKISKENNHNISKTTINQINSDNIKFNNPLIFKINQFKSNEKSALKLFSY